ncbi:fumarylacetoacetate hydrolase family protein [Sphingomonas bacterium]|uniref:fumarylacetoacetate hydrolase family protein n=1 Tax=Sphingomonas bacterium TaxID=1895847 RepID=UPI0015762F86|nr:fumarylacetoacetate hydrolase family protein [Sphingomonas bacterium]
MKFATRPGATPDGRLMLVSRDLAHAADAVAAETLQAALDDWGRVEPLLRAQADRLDASSWADASPLDPASLLAPLPRAWQFLDGSAFLAHNHILADAWDYAKRTPADPPLMYQGVSDRFYGPAADIPFRSEGDDIDFEAEYGVVLDHTPLGISPGEALAHVRLVVIINDWSLRAFGPDEMRGGFGFLQAKPPSSLSPVAVTPDELGDAWADGRVCLPLRVHRGDELFGRPEGGAMTYGFGELIAHAALTRDLCAGTVIGSGTVANLDAAEVGSGCIAERRALDALASQASPTPYLRFGERVRISALDREDRSVFGELDQRVVHRPS